MSTTQLNPVPVLAASFLPCPLDIAAGCVRRLGWVGIWDIALSLFLTTCSLPVLEEPPPHARRVQSAARSLQLTLVAIYCPSLLTIALLIAGASPLNIACSLQEVVCC